MEKTTIIAIVKKFLSGRFSQQTEERVQRWLTKEHNREEKEIASWEYWNSLELKADSDTYSALKRVNKRIDYEKLCWLPPVFHRKIMRVAAVLLPLFILAGGGAYYLTRVYNPICEVSVAYGERKYILLPDSSEVWLNSGSVVQYPKHFLKEQRSLSLEGEAYFSVAKDVSRPFIVKTSRLSVKVLGTKFDVKDYPEDDKSVTTLASGKVEILLPSRNSCILNPDEQLVYDKNTSRVKVAQVSSADAESWRKGHLIFTQVSFIEILRTLERRYNVVFENAAEIPLSRRYTIRFLKNESLDQVLDVLTDMIGFRYEKRKDKILLNTNTNF